MITRLRTLTEKSTLGFGRFRETTVDNLIKFKSNYLRWLYYDCSNITFTQTILNQIGITKLIDKPGKNPELHDANKFSIYDKQREIVEKKKNGVRHTPNTFWKKQRVLSRGFRTWKNQGH